VSGGGPASLPGMADSMTRILITGAAGNIGQMVRPRLARPDRVLRLLDTAELAPPGEGEHVELVHGSVTDMAMMERACQDADAVIHLGGLSREAPWQQILEVNIGGTYTVFEAARRQRVPRVIFASSIHAVGYTPRTSAAAPDWLRPRPDTNYGVGKVAGEAIGSLYADRYGMDVICIRMGACFDSPGHPTMLGSWLSPDDCARLLDACLTVDKPGFRIVWGVSANTRRSLSLAEAGKLGYQPRDDSEVFAERHATRYGDPDPDDPALRHLGAAWCLPEFDTARREAAETPER
jgi:uronate dehydrogenase